MNEMCKSHAMPSLYLCMHCPQTEMLCALCVKDSHAKCPDSHIIQSSDLKKIVVKPSEIDVGAEFVPLAKKAAEQNAAKLTQEFNSLKSRINESLNFVEYIDEDFYSLERIQGLKSQYNISFDKQKNKLCFEPRVYTDNLVTEKVSRAFKSTLQRSIESLASDIEAINLNIFYSVLDIRRFKHHPGLELTKLDSNPSTTSIKVTKKDTQGEKNFAYLTTPLSNAFFSITVNFGEEKEESKDSKPFHIGVCQLSDKVDWESLVLAKEPVYPESTCLKNSEFNFSFLKNEKLTFFDDKGTFKTELKLKPTGDYYFYVSIENPTLSITITE